jgi:predicted AlkP superfamily pyrophosphatase or phosphodiesterase
MLAWKCHEGVTQSSHAGPVVVEKVLDEFCSLMKIALGLIRAFALWAWLGASFSAPMYGAPRVGHVFIVSIDGGKPEVISECEMPVLKGLAAQGAGTWTAQTISPSVTLPSHTSMLTGVGPDKHHVLWNSWKPKAGVVSVPTIFAEAKTAGFSTAMFVGKEKFRHLLRPGTVDEFDFDDSEPRQAASTAGSDSTAVQSHTVLARIVAKRAAAYIVEKKPNLCFIHFTDADDTGHRYGWGSAEQKKAFGDVDAALGAVLRGIEAAGILVDSVVIVTADHGGHDKTHGSKQAADMNIPWIVWGKDVKSGYEITSSVTTYDTAATALWLLDIPQPDSFDGRPLTSAFNEAVGAATRAAVR